MLRRYLHEISLSAVPGTLLSQALNRSTPPSHIISVHRTEQPYFQALTFNTLRKQGSCLYHLLTTFGMSRLGIEPATFCTPSERSTSKPPGSVICLVGTHLDPNCLQRSSTVAKLSPLSEWAKEFIDLVLWKLSLCPNH